jgi:HK97 gp10 family phage protein
MAMKGRDKHSQRLKALTGAAVVKAANRVVYVGADMIRGEAFVSISRGSVSGKAHVPSRPGEPPNRDTGVLQGHLENQLVKDLVAEVSSNAPYAAALEFGTSKMEARPYMRPARDKEAPRIERLFKSEMADLVRRSGK